MNVSTEKEKKKNTNGRNNANQGEYQKMMWEPC